MKRIWVGALVMSAGALLALAAVSQPADGQGPDEKDRPPRPRGDGPPPPPPPRFEPGRVLPPPLVRELNLTREQREQLTKLEKEVRERLMKILTPEQKKKLEELRRRPPRPRGDGPPPPRDRRPERPRDQDRQKDVKADPNQGGIQWFATLESGLREAKRTGRPILLVSAAPHCAGVSGIW